MVYGQHSMTSPKGTWPHWQRHDQAEYRIQLAGIFTNGDEQLDVGKV